MPARSHGVASHLVPEAAHNITWLGHSELGGRPDGVQVMVNKGFAFVGHPFTGGGASVVDVRDPRAPRPVNFIKTASALLVAALPDLRRPPAPHRGVQLHRA